MEQWAFWVGALVAGALLAVGHWFPWPRKLHRLEAYIYGLASFLLGALAWLGLTGQVVTWLGLAALALIAGFVTVLAWLVDAALNGKARQDVEDRLDRYVGRIDDRE